MSRGPSAWGWVSNDLMAMAIPLLVPDLPSAAELLPYLRRIDAARWYTNFGPLAREFEGRIEARIADTGEPRQCVVSVSNATLGLEIALMALDLPRGSRVLMPSLTFVATATAAIRAGHVPLFCDIDPDTWLMTPEIAERAIGSGRVDAVMPVATYGCPCDAQAWDRFAKHTGLPVVIDAAGAYGNQVCGERFVTVFSLHATKALAAAEGGLVLSADQGYANRVRQASNFGIDPSNVDEKSAGSTGLLRQEGTNAKLSEYHAAVALAALARWEESASRRVVLHQEYVREINLECPSVRTQARSVTGVYSIFPVCLPHSARAVDAYRALEARGIGTRRWYCPPLNMHPSFSHLPVSGELEVCATLGERLLALPFHLHLQTGAVRQVVSALKDFLSGCEPRD